MQFRDGAKLYSIDPMNGDITIESKGQPKKFLRHTEGLRLEAVMDGIWYAFKRDKQAESTSIWSAKDGKGWAKVGEMPFREGSYFSALPLRNGRFLISAGFSPLELGDRAGYLAVAEVNENGLLKLREILDAGLAKPMCKSNWVRAAGSPPKRTWDLAPEYQVFQQMFFEIPIQTQDHYVFVSHETGYAFLYSREDGRFLRTMKFYSAVEEKMLPTAAKDLENPIISAQPTQDGHLFLASRTEDATLNARKIFEGGPSKLSSDWTPATLPKLLDEQKKAEEPAHGKALEAFSEILYWDWNMETGDKHLVSVPKGFPSKIWSTKMFEKFRFSLDLKDHPRLD